jgi:hypothetical protein
MHFGSFWSSSQEPVSWARCELAAQLFQHETYQVKLNEQLQDIIQIDATMLLPDCWPKSVSLGSINLVPLLPENQCDFEMCIDDLGSATPASRNHEKAWRMVTSSIKQAKHVLLS